MRIRDCTHRSAGINISHLDLRHTLDMYTQAALSDDISSVSTHNLYKCKLMRIRHVFSATLDRCKTLLARATASDEIVHTPHIHHADI